ADRIAHFMVHSVKGLHALLKARATSRGFLRSDRGTTVEAVGNNPLKFLPTPEDVLRVLMGPPTRTYLGMEEALDQSYQDVSAHQVATYTAMQEAVKRLLDDLGPDAVESAAGDDGGGSLGRMMGGGSNRKAKLWDAFKERWTARATPYDNGMVDVFMMHFGEAYGRAMRKKP
ncbi:MAG: type VI secretion system-associated FHA domain protein, partial [Pseudomonadota bacterium]